MCLWGILCGCVWNIYVMFSVCQEHNAEVQELKRTADDLQLAHAAELADMGEALKKKCEAISIFS